MKLAALLATIFFALPTSPAFADDVAIARDVARRDYDAGLAKIRADDAVAITKCRSGAGPEVEACLIQTRGKRMRAEQEAKARLDRVTQTRPLPNAQAKKASDDMLQAAKENRRSTDRDIDEEKKAASAECKKLDGAERKACNTEVKQRGDEARDMADAMFKKSRSDAKALKTK